VVWFHTPRHEQRVYMTVAALLTDKPLPTADTPEEATFQEQLREDIDRIHNAGHGVHMPAES
jgi:hypothetical protein